MDLFFAIKRDQAGLETLPDWLTILQWAYMQYPTLREDLEIEVEVLIKACKYGKLHYQGDINGWSWPRHKENPYLNFENNITSKGGRMRISLDGLDRDGCDCWLHKTDFKRYKESIGKWPLQVEGLRGSYWDDDESKAEAVGNQVVPKPLNNPSNDSKYSGLLNIPNKINDWFDVIDDMTRDFHLESGKIPSKIQAWGALWTSPPKGYEITTGIDKGEDCLKMPGAANLGKRSFMERWKKYTKVTIRHFNPL